MLQVKTIHYVIAAYIKFLLILISLLIICIFFVSGKSVQMDKKIPILALVSRKSYIM